MRLNEAAFDHIGHILEFLSSGTHRQHDVVLRCSDGHVQTYALVLAAISSVLKEALLAAEDPVVVAPELTKSEAQVFFKYLFGTKTEYDCSAVSTLNKVCQALGVDSFSVPVADRIHNDEEDDDYAHAGAVGELTSSAEEAAPVRRRSGARRRPLRSRGRKRRAAASTYSSESDSSDDERPAKQPALRRNDGEKQCEFCDRRYNHTKARNKHMLAEHFDLCKARGLLFACSECGMKFVSALGRDKHELSIHGKGQRQERGVSDGGTDEDAAFRCPFDPCDAAQIRSLRELRQHVRDCHPDKDHSCLACGVDCSSSKDLLQHMQSHRGAEARIFHSCDRCKMNFLSDYALAAHKRNKHSVSEKIACKVCQKTFWNAKFCENHEQRHANGDLDFPLAFRCNVTTASGEECGRTYNQKANLERHMRSHVNEKAFTCELCGKSFVDSTRLKHHRWIHANHKPYKCERCDKAFSHLSHLRNHDVQAHGGQKTHSCPVCPKSFLYAYQLKTHAARHKREGETVPFAEAAPRLEPQACPQLALTDFLPVQVERAHNSAVAATPSIVLSVEGGANCQPGDVVTFVADENLARQSFQVDAQSQQLQYVIVFDDGPR